MGVAMADDKPRPRMLAALHDTARLLDALDRAGCPREQADRLAVSVIAARYGPPGRGAPRRIERAGGPEDDPWGLLD